MFAVLKKNSDDGIARKKLRTLITDFDKKQAKDTSYHHLTEAEIKGQVESLTSAWFRLYLTLDPEEYLTKVLSPLLAVSGSLDLQIPSAENLHAIEKAMIFGGNPNYTIQEFPGLNHLFQNAQNGLPEEYSKIVETISPDVTELIGKWIRKITMP
jgi:uncharacterized protein